MVKRSRGKSQLHGTGKVVLSAIKKLTRNTGWTARTIVKFIKIEYNISDPELSRNITRMEKGFDKAGSRNLSKVDVDMVRWFFSQNSDFSDVEIKGQKFIRALKQGVKLGLLQMEQGRYRLSEMSQLVRSIRPSRENVTGRNKRDVLASKPLRICDSEHKQRKDKHM